MILLSKITHPLVVKHCIRREMRGRDVVSDADLIYEIFYEDFWVKGYGVTERTGVGSWVVFGDKDVTELGLFQLG